ncbi:MAG: helix-turn-helix transcriptional regulator [Bacillota bacterium]
MRRTIKNKIVVWRAEKGWTQLDLAKKLGVSRQTIISLEANRYSPSLKLAFEISFVFGKDINEVFQYGEDEKS